MITRRCTILLGAARLAVTSFAADGSDRLPGTATWNFLADIVEQRYRELRPFYEAQITGGAGRRDAFSTVSYSSRRPDARRPAVIVIPDAIESASPRTSELWAFPL